MEKYKILTRKSAARELDKIPKPDLQRIAKRIKSLSKKPHPSGTEKLSGQERYRIRQGDYRIVHSIQDKGHSVWIVKIGHRSEVYRS